MNIAEALILGLIQGLTEFLPVSSSGHLEIAGALFGLKPEESFTFTVAVHGATVLATITVFRAEIFALLKGFFRFRLNDETAYIIKILISMIPVAIAGFFLKEPVESLFGGRLLFVGMMLLVTSALLLAGHFAKNRDRKIGYLDALIIGIAQAIAVIPGISRSGATISTGLMLGNKKEELAKFSFLMVLLPVIGANLVELTGDMPAGPATGTWTIFAGFLAAFVSGYIACRWMISLVRRSRMIWFAVYCAAAGIISMIIA
ncbi:MAG TPA: undecaprenyl-diphosphate phosphatase [Bacteroidales bacterium]|nr:undecaprenyl-diphosphate phosphatase [Bacteroidales bacterium]HRR92865.1 undecaprenyl-diphosphate phosphatase [Bacteroidales bacterium]HRT90078.1 undecaprenyl-diphosphate phosphatase [Bacteroidales bacterium]